MAINRGGRVKTCLEMGEENGGGVGSGGGSEQEGKGAQRSYGEGG